MKSAGVTSAISAPIEIDGQGAALLYVDRFRHADLAHGKREQALVMAIADMIAVRLAHIEQTQVIQHLQESTSTAKKIKEQILADFPNDLVEFIGKLCLALVGDERCCVLSASSGSDASRILKVIPDLVFDAQNGTPAAPPLQWVDVSSGDHASLDRRLFGGGSGHPGSLELAHGGYVVIVDAEDLSHDQQRRLASVVQHGQLTLSDGATREVDVRLIIWNRDVHSTGGDAEAKYLQRLEQLFEHSIIKLSLPTLRDRLQRQPDVLESELQAVADQLQQSLPKFEKSIHCITAICLARRCR